MSQGLSGVALYPRQKGDAGGGFSPRSPYAPVSQGLVGAALSRRQKGYTGVVSHCGLYTRLFRKA
eukprot:7159677-Pyramimonas_sp.AAC.1